MTTLVIPTESTPQIVAPNANSAASQSAPAGASQGQEVMPQWAKDLAARVEAAEKVSRSKQSEADRAIAASNKRTKADIDAEVLRVTTYGGLTPEQSAAYRNSLVNDAIQQQYFNEQPANALPGNGAQTAPAQLSELDVLQKSNMSTSDPDVAQAVLAANGDPIALAMSLGALTAKRASSPPTSTGANAGIIVGSPPPIPDANDISDINDSATLYKMALKNIKRRGAPA